MYIGTGQLRKECVCNHWETVCARACGGSSSGGGSTSGNFITFLVCTTFVTLIYMYIKSKNPLLCMPLELQPSFLSTHKDVHSSVLLTFFIGRVNSYCFPLNKDA